MFTKEMSAEVAFLPSNSIARKEAVKLTIELRSINQDALNANLPSSYLTTKIVSFLTALMSKINAACNATLAITLKTISTASKMTSTVYLMTPMEIAKSVPRD